MNTTELYVLVGSGTAVFLLALPVLMWKFCPTQNTGNVLVRRRGEIELNDLSYLRITDEERGALTSVNDIVEPIRPQQVHEFIGSLSSHRSHTSQYQNMNINSCLENESIINLTLWLFIILGIILITILLIRKYNINKIYNNFSIFFGYIGHTSLKKKETHLYEEKLIKNYNFDWLFS